MMNLDLFELAIVVAVFVLAGVVKGVIGLGLPTIAMGLLGALMAPNQAAAILVVPALLTNVWQMWDGPALKILLRRLWPMLVCALLGTLPAAGILTKADVRLTTALIGGVLMVYALIREFSSSPACPTCRRSTSARRSWCKRWQSRRLCRRWRWRSGSVSTAGSAAPWLPQR